MSVIEAFIFGLVQGLSEFLPISSTAHIVITQMLFGYTIPGLAFEIFLHTASILAVLIYFRKDIIAVIVGFFSYFKTKTNENKVHFFYAIYIIVATLITGVLGLLLSDLVGDGMKSPYFIAITLALTGVALIFIEKFHRYGSRTEKEMTFKDAVFVGLGQTLAVLPGISRSGTTLVVSLLLGLSRDTSVRFSFLLSVPVILGSSALAFDDFASGMLNTLGTDILVISFLSTFVFSWIGIIWLIDFLKKSKLTYFAIYCFVLAILVALFINPSSMVEL